MQPSPYAQAGAKLIDNGYSAIPVLPGTKRPGEHTPQGWFGTTTWNRFCDRLPTDYEVPLWERWPDAGVCVAIDHRLKVVDIDTDDSAIMHAVLALLPDSPVKKRGHKGFSAFYKGGKAIVNQPFNIAVAGGKPIRVVDLLAHGRQTVLPPTIHPDTGRPYEWLTDETLTHVGVEALPELPDNIAEQLAAALQPFGYVPTQEHHALVRGDGDKLWREINDTALLNLDAWVPALKLPETKRAGKGYRAVAEWRGVENANLGIHRDGIKDWGSNESHTPLDLVMLAFRTDLYTATEWLRDRLGYHAVTDGFDVAGFVARSKAKSKAVATPLVAPPVAPAPVEATTIAPVGEQAPLAAPRATVDPFVFAAQAGLLGDIARWIHDTSRAPVPEFAMIAAVAFLAAFYGRRYVSPTGAGLNMYLMGIAGPGFGKDHPRKAIETLGHKAGFPWLIGPNKVTSDTAIEKVVRRRPCFVMPWDEVGVFLQSVSGKNAPSWTRSVRESLLELYSRSTGIWTGKEHADAKTDSSGDPVHCPTVSVLGMSTQSEFYEGITEQNLRDGMVARLTVIEARTRPERTDDIAPILTVPKALIESMREAYAATPRINKLTASAERDPKQDPNLVPATWATPEARKRWREIEEWQLLQIDENPDYEGIVGRCAEQTIKLATIRAISHSPAAPAVTIDDVLWGYALVQHSIDTIDEGARVHMAGSEFERFCKDIEKHIVAGGKDGIPQSVLMRKRGISKINKRDFEGSIAWLETVGAIVKKISGDGQAGGRPGLKYISLKETMSA